MLPAHKNFKNLNYQKIDWTNIETMTPELINQIEECGSFGFTKESWSRNKQKIIQEKNRIVYLIKDGPKVLGFVNGTLQSLSDYYTDLKFLTFIEKQQMLKGKLSQKKIDNFYKENKVKATGNIFDIYEFGILDKYQKMDLGTLLMARVVADQRVRYKSKFVIMYPTENTRKVNAKIAGKRPIFIKINKENTEIIKSIFRQFKSNFKYAIKPEGREQKIIISKNKVPKSRPIRSRAK